MTEEREARRLIEDAFSTDNDVSNMVARARQAAAAFNTAADAFENADPTGAVEVLHQHVDESEDPPRAAYDLCAAGAVGIAKLLFAAGGCDCGDENCTGAEIEARGENVEPIHQLAVMAINAASGGDLVLLNEVLDQAYRSHDGMAIYEMSVTFVTMRGQVRQTIADAS